MWASQPQALNSESTHSAFSRSCGEPTWFGSAESRFRRAAMASGDRLASKRASSARSASALWSPPNPSIAGAARAAGASASANATANVRLIMRSAPSPRPALVRPRRSAVKRCAGPVDGRSEMRHMARGRQRREPMTANRQILLAEIPSGKLAPEHFRLVEGEAPAPAEGEVLVRTRYISLDAANRAWMLGRTYRSQLNAGEVMAGGALAEVIESRDPAFAPGDLVSADTGWQDYAALPGRRLGKLGRAEPI